MLSVVAGGCGRQPGRGKEEDIKEKESEEAGKKKREGAGRKKIKG